MEISTGLQWSYVEGDARVWLEVIVRKFPAINLDVPLTKVEQLSLHDLCTSLVFHHPGGRLGDVNSGRLGDVNRLTVKLCRR